MNDNIEYFRTFTEKVHDISGRKIWIDAEAFYDVFSEVITHERRRLLLNAAGEAIEHDLTWYKRVALETMIRYYISAVGRVPLNVSWGSLNEMTVWYRRKPWVIWLVTLGMHHQYEEKT